jgi:E3 ubiquitin-protein ligase RNF144
LFSKSRCGADNLTVSGKGAANGAQGNNGGGNANGNGAKPRRNRRGGRGRGKGKGSENNNKNNGDNSNSNSINNNSNNNSNSNSINNNSNSNNNKQPQNNKNNNKNINNNNQNKNVKNAHNSATSQSSSSSSSNAVKRVECGVCFDLFPFTALFRIELCVNKSHLFCRLCHSAHLRAAVAERRLTPLQCMMSECTAAYCHGDARSFLSAAESALFGDLERRWKAGDRLRFCAALKCGTEHVLKSDAETRFVCTKCKAVNCAQCRTLWHAGLTCAKFQALPEHMRSPEDAHLLKLAHKEGWRQCPRCKNMIAKNDDDCKFVRCKCGAGFCFDCGAQYKSLVANSSNEHGEPSCACGLWDEAYNIDEQLDELDALDIGSPEYWAFLKNALQRRLPAFRDVIDSDDDSDEDCDGHQPTARLRVFASPTDLHDLTNDDFTDRVRAATTTFECWMCARAFGNAQALETHVSTTKKHAVLACCGVVFPNEPELARHRALRLIGANDGFRMRTQFDSHHHEASELDVYQAVERVAFHALDDQYGAHTHSSDEDNNYDDDDDEDAAEKRRVKRALRKRRRRRDERGLLRVASHVVDSRCPHCERTFSDPLAAVNHLKATGVHVSLVCCDRIYSSIGALARHIRAAAHVGPLLCGCGRPLGHDDDYDDERRDDDGDDDDDEGEYDDDEGEYDDDEGEYDDDEDGDIDNEQLLMLASHMFGHRE